MEGHRSRATARPVTWTLPEPGVWLAHLARVYEARAPLACGQCGRTIAPGEHFTRRQADEAAPVDGDEQARPARVATCRACHPFTKRL